MATDILTVAPTSAPTAAQLAALTVNQIRTDGIAAWKQFYAAAQKLWTKVWRNPNGLTPAQVAAAMGPFGKSAFDRFGATVAYIIAATPAGITPPTDLAVPAGYTVTYAVDTAGNPTGVVTITQAAS